MSEHRFHLCRWNDGAGCTAGWWMVSEIPGLVVMRRPDQRWSFRMLPRVPELHSQLRGPMIEAPRHLWGIDYSLELARRLVDHTPQLSHGFASRREALHALDQVLTSAGAADSALSQLLGEVDV